MDTFLTGKIVLIPNSNVVRQIYIIKQINYVMFILPSALLRHSNRIFQISIQYSFNYWDKLLTIIKRNLCCIDQFNIVYTIHEPLVFHHKKKSMITEQNSWTKSTTIATLYLRIRGHQLTIWWSLIGVIWDVLTLTVKGKSSNKIQASPF